MCLQLGFGALVEAREGQISELPGEEWRLALRGCLLRTAGSEIRPSYGPTRLTDWQLVCSLLIRRFHNPVAGEPLEDTSRPWPFLFLIQGALEGVQLGF